jgi:hypothetical protein
MSPIHRPWPTGGAVVIDVRLLDEVEAAFLIDCSPPPSVAAPLYQRKYAYEDTWPEPAPDDPTLEDDTREAFDGSFADLEETHYVQQLRGWNRARHGRITVDARWLTAVRNALDGLTLSLDEECERELDHLDYPDGYELRAEVTKSMLRTGTCGECQWCTSLRLRDECDAILDAAGYHGGTYYEAYCRDAA